MSAEGDSFESLSLVSVKNPLSQRLLQLYNMFVKSVPSAAGCNWSNNLPNLTQVRHFICD